MSVTIDRPGVVILVVLVCLPSVAVAISGGETTGSSLNGTNTTVESTMTTVSSTTTLVDTEDDISPPNTTTTDLDATAETTTVAETTGVVTTTNETVDTVTDSTDTTLTSVTSTLDGGDSVVSTTVTTPVFDSAASDTGGTIGGTTLSTGTVSDGTSATDEMDDVKTTVADVDGAATAGTTVASATTTIISVETAESSETQTAETTRTTTGEERTSKRVGDRKEARNAGTRRNDDESATTNVSGVLAVSDGTEHERGETPSGGPIPIPDDGTAEVAGAVLAVGLASHLPEVTRVMTDSVAMTKTTDGVPVVTGRSGTRFWRILSSFRYSRYDDSDPLEHELRADLYDTIQETPGLYLSELDDRLEVSLSTIRHHLRVLEREELVTGTKVRGKRRFYPDDDGIELAAALADGPTAAVLGAVARREPASVGELADEVERDPSTVTHHLKRLEGDGLVERERDGRAVVNRLTSEAKSAFTGEPVVSSDD